MSRKYSFYAGEYLKAAEYTITDNRVAITFDAKD